MESETVAVPGYLNRHHRSIGDRPARSAAAVRDSGRRASLRVAAVAMRAYEQRAEHHTRMRAWLIAQAQASASAAR